MISLLWLKTFNLILKPISKTLSDLLIQLFKDKLDYKHRDIEYWWTDF